MKEHDGTTYLRCLGCGAYVVEGEWEAHGCPPKNEQEKIPEDVQRRIDFGFSADVEALDEQVHDLKGNEAADINNGGMKSQIRWLHGEAGMPWSEIRGLLGIKTRKEK